MNRAGAFVFIALLGALGCSLFDPPTQLEVLRKNRERWTALNKTTYTLAYQMGNCECLDAWVQPVTIDVVNGSVFSVRNRTTGLPVVVPGSAWPTIDDIFDRLEQNLIEGYVVHVVYDGKFHFPGGISADHPGSTDSKYTITASMVSPADSSTDLRSAARVP